MHITLKISLNNTLIWYELHQQKNGINELMQAQEQIFIGQLKSRQNLNQIIILRQNKFFFTFSLSFIDIWFRQKYF